MENKYYTPVIEEFHVGFEFEMDDTWGGWMPLTLTEKLLKNPSVSLGSGNDRTNYYLRTRVKYLDVDDIKELGWVIFPRYAWISTFEDLEENGASFSMKDKEGDEVQLYYNNKDLIVIYDWRPDHLFQGKIKNKSELKKVMQMLNIL